MNLKGFFPAFSKTAFLNLFAVTVILSAAAMPALAYEEDTHFLMTYVICRSAGLTEDEALIVAAVDQGMDDSKDTNAIEFTVVPNRLEQWLWHAIDKGGDMKAAGILGRRDALFNDAVNDRDARNRLIRLGIFFHFQQDSWAHREHERSNHDSRTDYTPVTTPEGHGIKWGYQSDRPPYDPATALLSLEDGMIYASDFLRRAIGREPNAFFRDYKPAGGSIDEAWTRKSEFFNQIDIAGITPGSARRFLAELIRAQIETYDSSRGTLGTRWKLELTAKEGNLGKVARALETVCDRFKSSVGTIRLPSQQQKKAKGFDKMTTIGLLSLRPGSM